MPTRDGPPVGSAPEPPHGEPIVSGSYLAELGHCMECHTPIGAGGKRDTARLGAGGMSIDLPGESRVASSITPDPATGIGNWTDGQIIDALSHGVDRTGNPLSRIMPWPYFQTMEPEDLKAIVAWLRTLQPVRHAVAQ